MFVGVVSTKAAFGLPVVTLVAVTIKGVVDGAAVVIVVAERVEPPNRERKRGKVVVSNVVSCKVVGIGRVVILPLLLIVVGTVVVPLVIRFVTTGGRVVVRSGDDVCGVGMVVNTVETGSGVTVLVLGRIVDKRVVIKVGKYVVE